MSEDSYMQIVREKLAEYDFLESKNNPGLFFNNFLEDNRIFFIDMRKNPARFYGYARKPGSGEDVHINDEEVQERLKGIKKALTAVGCKTLNTFLDRTEEQEKKKCPHCGGEI